LNISPSFFFVFRSEELLLFRLSRSHAKTSEKNGHLAEHIWESSTLASGIFVLNAFDARRHVAVEGMRAPSSAWAIWRSINRDQGEYARAEPLSTKALEVSRRVLGAKHPDTLISMNNLAHVYYKEGKYGQAEPL
jgi:hypothetical protein